MQEFLIILLTLAAVVIAGFLIMVLIYLAIILNRIKRTTEIIRTGASLIEDDYRKLKGRRAIPLLIILGLIRKFIFRK